MIQPLSALLTRAKDIFQTEGLTSLLRGTATFLARCFFRYGTFYLYEHTISERDEADFIPRIPDFKLEIITSNQQASELVARGFDDFRRSFINARQGLDKGAIAFCVFIGRELAHIGWVALNEEAKNTFDDLPYHVDFSNREACTGGTVTIPKYEGNGLMTYGYFKRFQFLNERGIARSRNVVATSNLVSQKVHAKFGPKIYVKIRYLKILRWRFWKEIPLAQTGHT